MVEKLVRLLLIALAPAVPAQARSPYSWATWYAPQRAGPITIDGDLSDWSGIPAFAMDQEKFFFVGQGMSSSKWKGPSDLSARFQVTWDSEFLYVAVAVKDQKVTEPHGALAPGTDTGSWDDDGIEVMLDNDGCGTPRYYVGDEMHHEFHFVYSARRPLVFDNFWKPQPGAEAPVFRLPDGRTEPLAWPGEVMVKNDVTDRFTKAPYHGLFAFRRTGDGYNFELRLALPGATMKPINEGGRPIGFDLAVNDNDEGAGPLKQQLHWSGMSEMFWRNTQFFGTLVLLKR